MAQIDVNTLYSTFSTIAQTLGTAFGILAACSIYRLQSLCTMLEERRNALLRSMRFEMPDVPKPGCKDTEQWARRSAGVDFEQALLRSDKEGLWKTIQILCPSAEGKRQLYQLVDSVSMIGQCVRFVSKTLVFALWFTSLTVAAALALLPLSPYLLDHSIMMRFALCITLLGAGLCLIVYMTLIVVCIRDGWTCFTPIEAVIPS